MSLVALRKARWISYVAAALAGLMAGWPLARAEGYASISVSVGGGGASSSGGGSGGVYQPDPNRPQSQPYTAGGGMSFGSWEAEWAQVDVSIDPTFPRHMAADILRRPTEAGRKIGASRPQVDAAREESARQVADAGRVGGSEVGNPEGDRATQVRSSSTRSEESDTEEGAHETGNDPVNPGTGEYLGSWVDMELSGVGIAFRLVRTYRSRSARQGPLGFGWDHSYNERLESVELPCGAAGMDWYRGDGTVVRFGGWGGSYHGEDYPAIRLERSGDTWQLRLPEGELHEFNNHGLLQRIEDLRGNALSFAWFEGGESGPALASAIDTVGRAIEFSYDDRGHLAQVSVPGLGLTLWYQVDAHGDLVQFTDPAGVVETYAYDLTAHEEDKSYVPTDRLREVCEEGCGVSGLACSHQGCNAWATEARRSCEEGCQASEEDCRERAETACLWQCRENVDCYKDCRSGCGSICEAEARKACNEALQDIDCPRVCKHNCEASCRRDCNMGICPFDMHCMEWGSNTASWAAWEALEWIGCHVYEFFGGDCDARRKEFDRTRESYLRWCGNDCQACCQYNSGCEPGTCLAEADRDCQYSCADGFLYGSPDWYPDSCEQWSQGEGCLSRATMQCRYECGTEECAEQCSYDCRSKCTEAFIAACLDPDVCKEACDLPFQKNCAQACLKRCQAEGAHPSGRKTYGLPQELRHNLVAVTDGAGQTYLENTYGTDVFAASFDRVVMQRFGETRTRYKYYDRSPEMLRQGSVEYASSSPQEARARIDEEDQPYVDLGTMPVEICPPRMACRSAMGGEFDETKTELPQVISPALHARIFALAAAASALPAEIAGQRFDERGAGASQPLDVTPDMPPQEVREQAAALVRQHLASFEPPGEPQGILGIGVGERIDLPDLLPPQYEHVTVLRSGGNPLGQLGGARINQIGPMEPLEFGHLRPPQQQELRPPHPGIREVPGGAGLFPGFSEEGARREDVRAFRQEVMGIWETSGRIGQEVRETLAQLWDGDETVLDRHIMNPDPACFVRPQELEEAMSERWQEELGAHAALKDYRELLGDLTGTRFRRDLEDLLGSLSLEPGGPCGPLLGGMAGAWEVAPTCWQEFLLGVEELGMERERQALLSWLDEIEKQICEVVPGEFERARDPYSSSWSHERALQYSRGDRETGHTPLISTRIHGVTVVYDDNQTPWTYYVDDAGRILRKENHGSGARVDRNFDALGRLIGERRTFGDRTCWVYQGQGDTPVLEARLPAPGYGRTEPVTTRFTWGPYERMEARYAPNSTAVRLVDYAWDEWGQLTRVRYPDGSEVRYERDERGRPTRIVGRRGSVTQIWYDEATAQWSRRVVDVESAEPYVEEVERDGHGRIVAWQDSRGRSYTQTFLDDGKLSSSAVRRDRSLPATIEERSYNDSGELVRVERRQEGVETAEVIWELTYNVRGLVTQVRQLTHEHVDTQCFRYDGRHALLERVAPGGRRTRLVRDGSGHVVAIMAGYWEEDEGDWDDGCDSVGLEDWEVVATYERDASGRILRENRGLDWSQTYAYDGFGRTSQVRQGEEGAYESYGYNGLGHLVWWSRHRAGAPSLSGKLPQRDDPYLAAYTEWGRDPLGRVVQDLRWQYTDSEEAGRRWAADVQTRVFYEAGGRVVKVLEPSGRVVRTVYDGLDRPERVEILESMAGAVLSAQSFSYAQGGREVVATRQEPGRGTHVWARRQNASGDLLWAGEGYDIDGLATVFSATYDAHGRALVVDTADGVWSQGYDALGQLRARWRLGEGGEQATYEEFDYDPSGRLLVMRDGRGMPTRFEHDALGRLARLVYPDGSVQERHFVPGTSLPSQIIERDGGVVAFSYDGWGRLSEVGTQDGKRIFERDVMGLRVAKMVPQEGPQSMREFTYNSLGQLVREGSAVLAEGSAIEYGWDLTGQVAGMSVSGSSVAYQRDALGRLEAIEAANETLARYRYDAAGRPVGVVYGNAVVEERAYASLGRLLQATLTSPGGSRPAQRLAVTWESEKHIGGTETSWLDTRGAVSEYGRDGFGRLTSERYSLAWSGEDAEVSSTPAADAHYRWDDADNLAWLEWPEQGLTVIPEVGVNNSYAAFNGPVETDRAGRTLSAEGLQFRYDGFGQLREASNQAGDSWEFFYDALGELSMWRDPAGVETRVHSGIYNAVVERTAGSETTYVPGYGGNAVASLSSRGHRYLHYGVSRRLAAVSDQEGAFVEGYVYSAFAQPWPKDPEGNDVGWSERGSRRLVGGQPYFPRLGLHLFGQRWYSPTWGRFLTPDPAGYFDGPNLYAYAGNQPLAFYDPTGLAKLNTRNAGYPTISAARRTFWSGMPHWTTVVENIPVLGPALRGFIAPWQGVLTGSDSWSENQLDPFAPNIDWSSGTPRRIPATESDPYRTNYATSLAFGSVTMIMYGTVVLSGPPPPPAASAVASRAGAGATKVPALRPDIVLKGGRGGQNVKNLLGPANSAVKGGPGRIFITNDKGQVILDVTKTRVKPVTPGRGFGPKDFNVTDEWLQLIDKLHGGG